MTRREFRDLASPEEARDALADLDFGGGTEAVSLAEAAGRTLAERVDAGIDVPGFDRAAMDGYALRARDSFGASERDPAELRVIGTVDAGEEPGVAVDSGEAVEIATGGVIPPGADAVVPVERTSKSGDTVAVRTPLAPGDDVMAAGADVAAGERCLGAGTTLSPREIGLLAALGVDSVPVRSRPRVGIVSTGPELVSPGEPLDPSAGEIHDVNGPAIAAAVRASGGDPVRYARTDDDPDALAEVLTRAAAECDAVLSSGSTSASDRDVVYRVIENEGELLVHGVAIKPGKPTVIGRLDGAPYIGLPGYPVSALSVFRTFVAPALREATGQRPPERETSDARLASEVRYAEGRHRLLPVGLVADGSGDLLAYSTDKGSGATTSLAEAEGVVEMPATTTRLSSGERVSVARFAGATVPDPVGVGESDPVLDALLDALDAADAPDTPRYLNAGSAAGARRLGDGTPDFAAVGDPVSAPEEAVELASWSREWGLAVAAGDPPEISGIDALARDDVRFCTRTDGSALRAAFDALADMEIGGHPVRGVESPIRRVASGRADAGLCLRAHAATTDLEFVPLGRQRVRLLGNPERLDKPGMAALRDAAGSLPTDGFAGVFD